MAGKKIQFKGFKLSSNAKKVIVLCSMVALLVVTGVLNFVLNNQTPGDSNVINGGGTTTETFFSSRKSLRETARAEELSILDSIIASADSSLDAKTVAENKKLEIQANIEKELIVENLIKAKGIDEVFVSMSDNNVNIIVSQSELAQEQVAQIFDVIIKETGYKANQITVIPYSV